MPIHYRAFRNPDPPALVQIWNESLIGRGAAFLQGTNPLEHYVLAKPYFDREGLILAEADDTPIGFVHAGFGPAGDLYDISRTAGVICALVVTPSHRRRGVGSELLQRAIAYLQAKGAQEIYFGGMRPLQPFYWGLYGGSELPGVLASDVVADQFLQHRHFAVCARAAILDRHLDTAPSLADPRFATIKRTHELKILPRSVGPTWFEECLLSPLEMLEFRIVETGSEAAVAQAKVWDMDLFGWRWHQPSAGIIDVQVREDRRRQGFAKYLVTQILRYLQDQFYTLAEVQTMEDNVPALQLYRSLGFLSVDEGRLYRWESHA